MDSLESGALRWWAGVGNDRSTADCISGCRNAINIGQKIVEKEPLGLKYTQLIQSHTTAHYQKNHMRLLSPHENKHPLNILATNFKNRHWYLISQFYGIYGPLLCKGHREA